MKECVDATDQQVFLLKCKLVGYIPLPPLRARSSAISKASSRLIAQRSAKAAPALKPARAAGAARSSQRHRRRNLGDVRSRPRRFVSFARSPRKICWAGEPRQGDKVNDKLLGSGAPQVCTTILFHNYSFRPSAYRKPNENPFSVSHDSIQTRIAAGSVYESLHPIHFTNITCDADMQPIALFCPTCATAMLVLLHDVGALISTPPSQVANV